jgi:5-methylcytosine-specific restriction endonuclease McrA
MKKHEWRKLDKLAEIKCKDNASWTCEVCGRRKDQGWQMHWHHYFGRTHTSLRWVLENLFCLCAKCHKMSPQSFHENPEWGRKQFLDLRGQKLLKQLEKIAYRPNLMDFEENKRLMDAPIEEIIEKYAK